MTVESVTFRKEYHLDPMWHILLPVLAAVFLFIPLCFLLLPLLNIKTTGTPVAYIGLFVLFYPFAGLAVYELFRYRLIVTTEGIKCFDWLSSFQIEWSDMAKIERVLEATSSLRKNQFAQATRLLHLGVHYLA